MVLLGHHRYFLFRKVYVVVAIIIAFRAIITIVLLLGYSFIHVEKLDLLYSGRGRDGPVTGDPCACRSYRQPKVLTGGASCLISIILACPLFLFLILHHLRYVVLGGRLKLNLIWVYLCHIVLFDHEHLLSLLIYIDLKIVWGAISGPTPTATIDHDQGGLLFARVISIFGQSG